MSATISLHERATLLRMRWIEQEGNLWVALTRTPPLANALGDQLDEPDGGGYARAPYQRGEGFWAPTGYAEVYNLQETFFLEATGYWGLMRGYALVDAPESGMTLAVGTLVNPSEVDEGIKPKVPAGSITVGLYD